MDVDQLAPNLLEGLEGDGGVVDEGPAFLLGAQLATQDALAVEIQVMAVKKAFQVVSVQLKLRFHHAFHLLVEQHARVGAVAQHESQGSQQDGLACAGLAGNHAEAFSEVDRQFPDEGIVPYVEMS